MRTSTTLTALAVGALAVIGLVGCSSGSDDASADPTVTETVTPSASQTSVTPTPSDDASPTATSGAGTGTGSTGGSAVSACTSSHLSASIAEADGGAAGSVGVSLVLTNTGTASCTLQGWPGVSLVGGGDGTQVGAAAKFDRSTPHGTVTVAAGSTATAPLSYVQAQNYDKATCKPAATDGFRIYPPGQKASLYAKYAGVTGCASKTVSLLTVGALQ